MPLWKLLHLVIGSFIVLPPLSGPAFAAAPIPVELNKLEPLAADPPGCRVYFVVSNPEHEPFVQLRLDLVLFGTDGVITRRLALDLGPLPAQKTAVHLFDLAGVACDSIGQILINDVLSCQTGDQAPASADAERKECLDRLTTSSKAKAPLVK
jgi:hypothetical protein